MKYSTAKKSRKIIMVYPEDFENPKDLDHAVQTCKELWRKNTGEFADGSKELYFRTAMMKESGYNTIVFIFDNDKFVGLDVANKGGTSKNWGHLSGEYEYLH